MKFKPVDPRADFAKQEEEVLGEYVFYRLQTAGGAERGFFANVCDGYFLRAPVTKPRFNLFTEVTDCHDNIRNAIPF